MSIPKIKFKKKKSLHEDLEEHHKKMEKITKDAIHILKNKKSTKPMLKLGGTEYIAGKQGKINRIKTGIKGFDKLIEGGIPENSLMLLTGATGAGKSTFAMNFLMEGCKNGENGVYICLEENIEQIINEMRFFGWSIDDYIKNGKILIVQPELYNYDALLTSIEEAIDKVEAKRLVIDSISIIGMYFENPFKIRKSLLELGHMLKKLGCTTMAITEIAEGTDNLSNFGIEEFIADGVIILYYFKRGNSFLRAIAIRKMRSTDHSKKIHPIEIKRPGGINVFSSEEVYAGR